MRFSVPTENRFSAFVPKEMARDGFQTVTKRKRLSSGEVNGSEHSDSITMGDFINCSPDDKLNFIFDELRQVRLNQDYMNKGMLAFQETLGVMGEKLGQVIEVTNNNSNLLKTLAYKSIDHEARSRRNNLIFWGIAENYNENCFFVIRDFIRQHLDLDAGKMYLARAHRLGPRKVGYSHPHRPIIVNFRDFCDTDIIMSKASMLRSTPFSISYDLPKEINEARKKLWDELKSIKASKPSVNYQILYPAKLVVEGKTVRDEFPDWNEIMKGSRIINFSHIDQMDFERFDSLTHDKTCDRNLFVNSGPGSPRDSPMNEDDDVSIEIPITGPDPNNRKDIVNSSASAALSNKDSLFRPFDSPKPQKQTCSAPNNQNDLPVVNSIRFSRTMIRGQRRTQSVSVPRGNHASHDTREIPGENSKQTTKNNTPDTNEHHSTSRSDSSESVSSQSANVNNHNDITTHTENGNVTTTDA